MQDREKKNDESAKEVGEVKVRSGNVWVSFKEDKSKSNRNTLITQSFAPA
jgi:hypothetical protein